MNPSFSICNPAGEGLARFLKPWWEAWMELQFLPLVHPNPSYYSGNEPVD